VRFANREYSGQSLSICTDTNPAGESIAFNSEFAVSPAQQMLSDAIFNEHRPERTLADHPANMELMSYLLAAFGHTVVAAKNGLGGVEAACDEMPDLIVCDVRSPDIDGFEVACRLRSSQPVCSIPLVAVTALAMMGDRDRGLAPGYDGYVIKPIDPAIFVQQIEASLPPGHHSLLPLPIPTRAQKEGADHGN
jgi:two-component system cell cycle response regulator DivK